MSTTTRSTSSKFILFVGVCLLLVVVVASVDGSCDSSCPHRQRHHLDSTANEASCPRHQYHSDDGGGTAVATGSTCPHHNAEEDLVHAEQSCPHHHHHDVEDAEEEEEDPHTHHDHHHHDHHDDEDGEVPDWIAEVVDPATGEVREVPTLLQTAGLTYLSPTNFRYTLANTVARHGGGDDRSDDVRRCPTVIVFLYRPNSALCSELLPSLVDVARGVKQAQSADSSSSSRAPVWMAVFRVNAYADQDEIDADVGGWNGGTGGDGAEVLRESRCGDLLDDVPAVVAFVPDASSMMGYRVERWSGPLSTSAVLGRYYTPSASSSIIAEGEDVVVGNFTSGLLDV